MQGKVKVLILAHPSHIAEMKDYLSKDADIEIALITSDPGAVVSRLSGDKPKGAGAVLIDYCTPGYGSPLGSPSDGALNEGALNDEVQNGVHPQSAVPAYGDELLQRISRCGIPIVIIANNVHEGFAYLNRGANDMIVRRATNDETAAFFYRMVSVHITEAVKKFGADKTRSAKINPGKISGKVIAIGSSTGGTETVLEILKEMPSDAPPIVIVQHMPPVFTKLYADRADGLCKINVWEAKNGDVLANGLALIAPGGHHMTLRKNSGMLQAELNDDPPVWSQRPSVDVLFNSVARTVRSEAVGVILTGMGEDGAEGLLNMRKNGAYTIGQDQESCIVYGMPKAAFERGAVEVQLPLSKIAREILDNAY